MINRSLVISGGGSKGAFAVGVVKQLADSFPNLGFDSYVGTSTGSLIVGLAAIEDFDLLEKLYTAQKTENIILKDNLGNRLSENSIFDASPLWILVNQFYTDDVYNKIVQQGKNIYLNTVCLQTEELVVFTTDQHAIPSKNYAIKQITSADHFRRAVMASACQPVFMPPIRVNLNVPGESNPNNQFVDGGVREYAGLQMAIDNNASEVFLILLSPETSKSDSTVLNNLFAILQRTIDIFSTDVGKNDLVMPAQYNEALIYLAAVKNNMRSAGISEQDIASFFNVPNNPFRNKVPVKIFVFRPDADLGGGPGGLTFNPTEMKGMLAKGRMTTDKLVAALNPGDITWA
jgi:NTE family protein